MLYGAVETTSPPAEGDLLLNTPAMHKLDSEVKEVKLKLDEIHKNCFMCRFNQVCISVNCL